ncbi:unnamed protein product [Linum trigynum]|uniref:Beta-galactosidase beta-sandwich domain-containing protein n=1 Tax=Linum trigynum TaxID=586398 RepID=A0AAV2D9M3_9ROSI
MLCLLQLTKYTTKEASSCFISNKNHTQDAKVTFQGNEYCIPAWSVSIFSDCAHEAYNTFKLTTQTSKPSPTKSKPSPAGLSEMVLRPEYLHDIVVFGLGKISTHKIVDQKDMTDDKSDYLWYMTT